MSNDTSFDSSDDDLDEMLSNANSSAVAGKSMLEQYYGITAVGNHNEGEPKENPAESATSASSPNELDDIHLYQTASSSSALASKSPLDLDSASFQSGLYVNRLLDKLSMRELIEHDNRMIASKRHLDSDMQQLVYENYNKFISATDMIRKMKNNVNSMETQMEQLNKQIQTIANTTKKIEDKLTPNREKVEKFVSVSRLLKRLEFLFELPKRLNQSIQIGAYQQAIKYYKLANNILSQYLHIQSFQAIQAESQEIIENLKLKLKKLIRDPSNSSDKQMNYAAILIQLNVENTQQLLDDICSTRKERLARDLAKAQEIYSKSLKLQLNQQNNAGNNESKEENIGAEKDLLDLLQQHFLIPFTLFAENYINTLIKPQNDNNNSNNSSNSGSSISSNVELCWNNLLNLTRELFSDYFNLVRSELLAAGNKININEVSPAETPTASAESANSSPNKAENRSIAQFCGCLSNFYASLSSLFVLLPASAELHNKVKQLIEHSVRNSLLNIAKQSAQNVINTLLTLEKQVNYINSTQNEQKDTENSDKPAEITENSANSMIIHKPSWFAHEIYAELARSIDFLRPILSIERYIPDFHVNLGQSGPNSGSNFVSTTYSFNPTDLYGSHYTNLLQNLCNLLLFGRQRYSDGPIYEYNAANLSNFTESFSFSTFSSVKEPYNYSLFYLYCSQINLYLESKELPAFSKVLQQFFSQTSAQNSNSSSSSGNNSATIYSTQLAAKYKENAQLNLQRYVEIVGQNATKNVKIKISRLISANNSSNQSKASNSTLIECSDLVDYVSSEANRLEFQLNHIFPRLKYESNADNPANSANSLPSGLNKPSLSISTGSGPSNRDRMALNRDISRLFSSKVATFGPVKFNRIDPIVSFYKILLKSSAEIIRNEAPFSFGAFQQLEYDFFCVKALLPVQFIMNSTAPENLKQLHNQLEEIFNVSVEKTLGNGGLQLERIKTEQQLEAQRQMDSKFRALQHRNYNNNTNGQ
jgi:hypothetical protein